MFARAALEITTAVGKKRHDNRWTTLLKPTQQIKSTNMNLTLFLII